MVAKQLNQLVGASTRYIAGRNAMQTSYWRTGSGGKLMKYTKNCDFGLTQKLPKSIRLAYVDRNYFVDRPKTVT